MSSQTQHDSVQINDQQTLGRCVASATRRLCGLLALSLSTLWLSHAHAATYCVDANATPPGTGACWSAPFRKLEDALSAAAASAGTDEIWLRSGTYVPAAPASGERQLGHFALIDGVGIYGGFAGNEQARSQRNPDAASNATVLSGDVLGDDGQDFANRTDNINTILRMNAPLATAILDGVTVRGGYAAGAAQAIGNLYGGGLNVQRGLVKLHGVRFLDNEAINAGGAIAVDAQTNDAGVTISRCEFRGNRVTVDVDAAGGGGAVWLKSIYPVAITHSRFLGNQCLFSGCRGSAIRIQVLNQNPRALISNTVFSGNRISDPGSSGGAALWVDNQGAEIVHTTFSENYDGSTLQAIKMRENGLIDIRNSIVDGGLGRIGTGMIVSIAHSLINRCGALIPAPGPGLPSDCPAVDLGGNLRASLGFVDALGSDDIAGTADDDLRLGIGAAAVDRGDNSLISNDINDIDGDGISNEVTPLDLALAARRADVHGQPDAGNGSAPIVDLGAYETIGAELALVSGQSLVTEGPNVFASAAVRLTTPNNAPLDSPVSVVATAVDGTAVALTNYFDGAQVLQFAAGTASGSVQQATFPIIDNSVPQPALNFSVQLSSITNAALNGGNTHTVSIIDNDGVSVLDAGTLSGQVLEIPVSLPSPYAQPVLVTYTLTGLTAVAGVHFDGSVTPIVIPPGETSGLISIPTFLYADGQTRTLRVNLTSASGLTLADPMAIGSIVAPIDAVFSDAFE